VSDKPTPSESIANGISSGGRVWVDETNIVAVGDLVRRGYMTTRKDVDGLTAEITAEGIGALLAKARQ